MNPTGNPVPSADDNLVTEQLTLELAHADAAGGLYTMHGWHVRDDRGRQRVLVTLHVDRGR